MTDRQRYAAWRRTHPPIMGADLTTDRKGRPPRDNLVRAVSPVAARWDTPVGIALRADNGDEGDGRTLHGHYTVWDTWTEINSMWEGNFLERIMPRSTTKTHREQTPKVMFQHGTDPQIGDRVIAETPSILREDEIGPYFEARLFDNVDPLVYEGIRAGVYGISFRFSVMREEWVDDPEPSDHNPHGIPERTIKEMRVSEFGPVTFPAYPGADVAIRSLTDEMIIGRATSDPEQLRAMLEYLERRDAQRNELPAPAAEEQHEQDTQDTPAPSTDRAEETPHPVRERRDTRATYGLADHDETPSWRL